ncbi:hypothetical protein [Halococcus sp. AFM35]|uniref:hypothetical protein n=1 Tax=Halococcus sp. AFM35 TaxID=3421653 RepID=UPI003EBF649B
MASTTPPHRAAPETLQALCLALKDGPLNKSKLSSTAGVSRRKLDKTIDYGRQIGFLSSDHGEIKVVGKGNALSYAGNSNSEEVSQIFYDAVEEFTPYRTILVRIFNEDKTEGIRGKTSITREAVEEELRIVFEFDGKSRTVEDAANTCLKTLDAAGLGTYKQGRKGYPTRLSGNSKLEETGEKWTKKYESKVNAKTVSKPSGTNADARSEESRQDTMNPGIDDVAGAVSGAPIVLQLNLSNGDWSKSDVLEILDKAQYS